MKEQLQPPDRAPIQNQPQSQKNQRSLLQRIQKRLRNQFPVLRSLSGWFTYDSSQEQWEDDYQSGRWNYLNKLEEVVRYSTINGYITHFKPNGSILDVGGGEGILQERLQPQNYARYVCVDISQAAIQQASAKADEKTQFVCADVTTYTPNEQFDVIVFNEVVYYIEQPIPFLKRYEGFIKPGGIFLISIWDTQDTTPNWKLLDKHYSFVDSARSTNLKTGLSWICKVWVKE